jgi:hypothetical protein
MPHPPTPRWSATQLRRDLSVRAAHLARTHKYLHDLSTGSSPTVLFGREDPSIDQPARHGNFHPASYAAICARPDWNRRLSKVHTASRRSPARNDWQWMELDSASSSDALLMNIFCHPQVFDGTHLSAPVATLLNVDPAAHPCFGAHPGVPLNSTLKPRTKRSTPPAAVDRTEIDLVLGNLLIEAKLTESDFQTATPTLIQRYRDLEAVFKVDGLSRKILAPPPLPPNVDPDDPTVNLPSRTARVRIGGYQLIRNVLAAFAADASFCVLCDARRQDLVESWYSVLRAVRSPTFATRLKLLTWQELSQALPADLQSFLKDKYGIANMAERL